VVRTERGQQLPHRLELLAAALHPPRLVVDQAGQRLLRRPGDHHVVAQLDHARADEPGDLLLQLGQGEAGESRQRPHRQSGVAQHEPVEPLLGLGEPEHAQRRDLGRRRR
jgi:hypothetical protein